MCRDCKSNGISLFSKEKERAYGYPATQPHLAPTHQYYNNVRVAMLGLTEAPKNSTGNRILVLQSVVLAVG
jgi:hypothetical protein